jgi:Ser/Thr protein kinase RdoA (MazF antagonist)
MTFRQDNQFPVNFDNVKRLTSSYDLKLLDYDIMQRGIENTSLAVDTYKGNFVLRIYRKSKKTDQEIVREVDFMQYLTSHDLPVPKVERTQDGECFSKIVLSDEVWEWQAILMQFVKGTHPKSYNLPLISDMASKQARMHLLGQKYLMNEKVTNQLTILEEGEFIKLIDLAAISNSDLLGLLQRVKDYRLHLSSSLPLGYSQFDYNSGNLVTEEDKVIGILDFDDMLYGPLIVCLGYALGYIINNEESVKHIPYYIEEYEKIRKLSPQEKGILSEVTLFKHYVTNCLNVLAGKTTQTDVDKMLYMEKEILNLKHILP